MTSTRWMNSRVPTAPWLDQRRLQRRQLRVSRFPTLRASAPAHAQAPSLQVRTRSRYGDVRRVWLPAGEQVDVTLFSTPRGLGTVTAADSGNVSITFEVLASDGAGEHRVEFSGPSGTFSVPFTLVLPAQSSSRDSLTEFVSADRQWPQGFGPGALSCCIVAPPPHRRTTTSTPEAHRVRPADRRAIGPLLIGQYARGESPNR